MSEQKIMVLDVTKPLTANQIELMQFAAHRTPEMIAKTPISVGQLPHSIAASKADFKDAEGLVELGFFKFISDNGTPDWEWYQKIYVLTGDGLAFYDFLKVVLDS